MMDMETNTNFDSPLGARGSLFSPLGAGVL